MDFIYEYKEGELPSADDIKFVYEYEPFKEYAHDMKEMADAGCWSRSALTNTVTDDDIEQKMDATNGIGWLCCFDSVV